jgi:putative DNA primase/helicase
MKTNRKTTDAVIGRWPEVFEHYGLPPVTGKRHFKGKCPACQSKAVSVVTIKMGAVHGM